MTHAARFKIKSYLFLIALLVGVFAMPFLGLGRWLAVATVLPSLLVGLLLWPDVLDAQPLSRAKRNIRRGIIVVIHVLFASWMFFFAFKGAAG